MLSLVLFTACSSHSTSMHGSLAISDSLTANELNSLRSGDIIFRMGYGALSLSIAGMLNDTIALSHCGIIAKDSSGIAVIHTISPSISSADGMQQCSIEEFTADSRENSIAVVRFKHGEGQKIANKAAYYLSRRVPFDTSFDLADSSAFFCSELPIRILKDEFGFELLPEEEVIGNSSYRFSLFFNPQHFQTIVYHLSR